MPYLPSAVATSPLLQHLERHLGPPKQGKVRAMFDLGDFLLMVMTNRISVFDRVLPVNILGKGRVLTSITVHFLTKVLNDLNNHLAGFGEQVDMYLPEELHGDPGVQERTMVVIKRQVVPIEAIVRGYLTGSGYEEYKETGSVCGIKLPAGLRDGDRLPEPIFTPSTKAETGHDENITEAQAVDLVGVDTVRLLKKRALETYRKGAAYAESRGLVLADTKFEFGEDGMLLDEVLTPDSSRYWTEEGRLRALAAGITPPSHDKQIMRDCCKRIQLADGRVVHVKNLTPEEVERIVIPAEICEQTSQIYLETQKILIGEEVSA